MVVLASCASAPPSYQYFEPAAAPPTSNQLLVNGSPRQVQEAVIAELRGSPFEITKIDPAARYVIAEYSGDPSPYLDCGLLLTTERERGARPEATPAVIAERDMKTWGATHGRSLQLDGRLLVVIERRGQGQSLVTAHGTYVLSKRHHDEDGEQSGSETIAFTSGQRSGFRKGTICQPTGAFERVATSAVQGTAIAALPGLSSPAVALGEPARSPEELELEQTIRDAVFTGSCAEVTPTWIDDRNVRLTGVASDLFAMDAVVNAIDLTRPELKVENRIEILSKPACEAYGLTLRDDGFGTNGARVEVLNLADGVVREGTPLTLALDVPADHANVLVAHFRTDGSVDHFQIDTPSHGTPNGWMIDTPEQMGPPYGRDLILAVATREPLFASAPSREAEAFVPELRRALEALPAGAAGARTGCAVITTKGGGGNGLSIAPGLDIC